MTDRENVMAELTGLQLWLKGQLLLVPGHEDWQNALTVCTNALDLLKEHGHGETFIVIDNKTGEEADIYNIALHEEWAQHLMYCDMDGWAIEDDGTLLLVDECGRFAYADRERFKVKWNG